MRFTVNGHDFFFLIRRSPRIELANKDAASSWRRAMNNHGMRVLFHIPFSLLRSVLQLVIAIAIATIDVRVLLQPLKARRRIAFVIITQRHLRAVTHERGTGKCVNVTAIAW